MRGTWGVWCLLGLLWLCSLPLRPLFDPDEGRYAEIPREMVASGDWVTPTLNGVKYFEKPPLQYWATATIYSVAGAQDWASRLWAATLGFLCLPMVFVFTLRSGASREQAAVATAILALNPFFVIVGQVNLLDQAFSFLLTAAVFSFALAQRGASQPRTLRRGMLATWVFLALAVLSKGIVAPLLAGVTLAIYLAVTRTLAPLRRLELRVGLPVFLIIVLPWFVLVQARNPEFAQFFFVHEHFARYLTTVHERVEPWWYFIGMVLIACTPVIFSLNRARQALRAAAAVEEFHSNRFLLIWCAVVLVFFSLSSSKLAPYVLPMMPPLAVLLAHGVIADPKALRRAAWVLTGTLCFFSAGLLAYTWWRNGALEANSLGWGITVIVSVCAAAWFVLSRRTNAADATRWTTLAAASIFGYQALILTYAGLPPVRSARALAREMAPLIDTRQTIYSVGQYRHTLAFYLGRTMQVFEFRGELEFGLADAGISSDSSGLPEFRRRWTAERDAIAVIAPDIYEPLAASGLPGRIIARDSRSIVVSRQ